MERINLYRRNLESPAVQDAYHRIFATLRNQTRHILPFKTVFLTSCHPKEGKTAVSMGLARYCSQLGFNVLIVNGQTRHSGKDHNYGLETEPGWLNYLNGEATLEELTVPVKKNLTYVPLGQGTGSPLQFLMTKEFEKMLALLSKPYDLVLLDGPSLEEGSDAFLMAGKTDGVILIVAKGQTTLKELKHEKERIEGLGTKWVGVLINKA